MASSEELEELLKVENDEKLILRIRFIFRNTLRRLREDHRSPLNWRRISRVLGHAPGERLDDTDRLNSGDRVDPADFS